MILEQNVPMDPAALAASVRDLALQANRVLKDPTHRQFELRALARRITSLQPYVPSRTCNDLSRWLENLRLQVESARLAGAHAHCEDDEPSAVAVG